MSKQKNWKNWENVACLAELKSQTVEPQKVFFCQRFNLKWSFCGVLVYIKKSVYLSQYEKEKIQMIHLERDKI